MPFIRPGRSFSTVVGTISRTNNNDTIAAGDGGDPIPETAIWVGPSGNDTTGAGTYASPYATFTKAFTIVSSGGTVAAKNGTYTGSTKMMGGGGQPPAGTSGNLTRIRAETDGGVVIDGQGSATPMTISVDYISIEGFKFLNGETGGYYVANLFGDFCQMKRCAIGNGGSSNFDGMTSIGGSNNLLEDCWAWGRGKAGFEVNARNNTFRRCVARPDTYGGTLGHQGFLTYADPDDGNLFENCIVIDQGTTTSPFEWKGGWRTRDMSANYAQTLKGCIVLNSPYSGYQTACTSLENCIAWDVAFEGGIKEDSDDSGYSIVNCTVGETTAGGIRIVTSSITNCLHVNVSGGNSTGSYCHYDGTTSPGGTNVTTGSSGLLYLPRIESGSACDGTGSGGADKGANVLKRYVNGTLTDDNLWPWPYEDRIKSDFSTDFGLSGVTPTRGFCTGTSIGGGSQTLTKYIWEYLGNEIPSGIY